MNIFQVDPGPTGTYRNVKVVMSGTRLPEICIVAIKEPFLPHVEFIFHFGYNSGGTLTFGPPTAASPSVL